jgi:hypothetical protein
MDHNGHGRIVDIALLTSSGLCGGGPVVAVGAVRYATPVKAPHVKDLMRRPSWRNPDEWTSELFAANANTGQAAVRDGTVIGTAKLPWEFRHPRHDDKLTAPGLAAAGVAVVLGVGGRDGGAAVLRADPDAGAPRPPGAPLPTLPAHRTATRARATQGRSAA